MIPVLTAAETKALDEASEARGIPVDRLMERAGAASGRAAVAVMGGAYGRRVVVVCGKGNNGGDGLVAARHLAAWGARPRVFLLSEDLRGPAAANLARLETAGVPASPYDEGVLSRALEGADLAMDAIFGTGFQGEAADPHRAAIDALNRSAAPLVSIDVPSGVEGDTGAVRGPALWADVTVTLGAPKVGDVLYPGAAHAGVLEVADIGFPGDLLRGQLELVEEEDVAAMIPMRPVDAHKRSAGVVLVVAGSRTMTGAPRLVAEGAYRAGAGLVTVAVPEGIVPVVGAGLAEATFLPLPEGDDGAVAATAWEEIEPRLSSVDAVAIGPGLSTGGGAPELVRRLVRECPVPLTIDADALNAFAGRAAELAERGGDAVLTPHDGELARLLDIPASDIAGDRVGVVRKAVASTRAVVLLKGPRTLVASPDGNVRVSGSGTPALATGGTGDVLTGIIAAYLARGSSPLDAATAAAYVHGVAGRVASEESGDGVVAGDVARGVPRAVGGILGA